MRERLAHGLDHLAFLVMRLSDRVMKPARYEIDVTPLYDETGWPTEVDNEDPRNMGESPV